MQNMRHQLQLLSQVMYRDCWCASLPWKKLFCLVAQSLLPNKGWFVTQSLLPNKGWFVTQSLLSNKGWFITQSLLPNKGWFVTQSLLPNKGWFVTQSLLPNKGWFVTQSLLPIESLTEKERKQGLLLACEQAFFISDSPGRLARGLRKEVIYMYLEACCLDKCKELFFQAVSGSQPNTRSFKHSCLEFLVFKYQLSLRHPHRTGKSLTFNKFSRKVSLWEFLVFSYRRSLKLDILIAAPGKTLMNRNAQAGYAHTKAS